MNLLAPDISVAEKVLRPVILYAFLGPRDLRAARRHHGVVSGPSDE